ncbi:potassium-transporting ATPase subunit C [Nostoc sp. UHCC 0870]|nr:potassium-transporting ATPase subunit C [Nostoc sp. UHCC 0870]UKO98267.1 potassium-transporting ATPase subunit C [Nostoc sp. UHCC 0870]
MFRVVGYGLISQVFRRDRYFWSRPSIVDYSSPPQVATTGISS